MPSIRVSAGSILAALAGASPGLLPSSAAASQPFTVIGMPDTQNYSEFFPDIYRAQTQWIVNNRSARDIRFVSHYGDVVNHGDRLNEWNNADVAMRTLDDANIPYGVVAGNHDITPSGSAGSAYIPQNFRNYFGPQRFAGKDFFGEASPSGMSSYQVFQGGGKTFLALHLECDTAPREMAWAQGILDRHRDKPVMLTTHRYLQDAEDYTAGVPVVPSGRYPSIWYGVEGVYPPDGVQSNEFFDRFVKMNKNIFMVNCGHFHEEYRQTSTNRAGLPVHEVLADYQDDPNGGNGWLRIMQFDTAQNRINVESYSPTLNQYRTADESQFSLNVDFDRYQTRSTERSFSFRNGVNGYEGTKDTWINENARGSSYGNSGVITSDDDTTNSIFSDRRGQALLRFDDIFTQDVVRTDRVPLGAEITEATLRIHISDDIDSPLYDPSFRVYMMTRPWDETSTWDSLVNGLTQGSDFGILLGSFLGDNVPDGNDYREINVLAALQAWANGAPNYGFCILPEIISGNDDGIDIFSSEAANILLRPVLDVTWLRTNSPRLAGLPTGTGLSGMAVDLAASAVPAPTTAAFALFAAVATRRRR